MYIYIYIYTHTYTYIYIYTHIIIHISGLSYGLCWASLLQGAARISKEVCPNFAKFTPEFRHEVAWEHLRKNNSI